MMMQLIETGMLIKELFKLFSNSSGSNIIIGWEIFSDFCVKHQKSKLSRSSVQQILYMDLTIYSGAVMVWLVSKACVKFYILSSIIHLVCRKYLHLSIVNAIFFNNITKRLCQTELSQIVQIREYTDE